MASYTINKGIGNPPEFKGLTSQYLFIFASGLLSEFILFVILYLAGIPTWICIAFAVISATILVFTVFHLNKKYGRFGLMKLLATRQHPRFIINRKTTTGLFTPKK